MARKIKKRASNKHNERIESLVRILIAIVSGIILAIWRYLIFALAIVNFFITIITGKRHTEIAEFSEYWNTEYYKYFRYLTFVSNKRPFPFSNLRKTNSFKEKYFRRPKPMSYYFLILRGR